MLISRLFADMYLFCRVEDEFVSSFAVGLIHGDMNQVERNDVITSFKNKSIPILVATDVAGKLLLVQHFLLLL